MARLRSQWLAAALASVAVACGAWAAHDSDSLLYAAMAEDLAARPVGAWLAPAWQGHWGRQGLFVEHPAGHLAAAAALVRLGATGSTAVATLNALAWAASLTLLGQLARRYGDARWGVRAQACWVASPAFLQYLVRGNQEHPLTACVLAAVVSLACARTPPRAALGFGLATSAALAIKGLAGLACVPLGLAAVALLPGPRGRRAGAWALGCALAAAATAAFLQAYARAAHADFWALHLAQQVGHSIGTGLQLRRKLANLAYYAVRPAWYAAPAMALLAWRWRTLGLRATFAHPLCRLGAAALACYVGGFSLADRKACRYLLPAYPLLALAATGPTLPLPARHAARLRRAEAWWGRYQGAALLALVLGKLAAGHLGYTFVRLWPGA